MDNTPFLPVECDFNCTNTKVGGEIEKQKRISTWIISLLFSTPINTAARRRRTLPCLPPLHIPIASLINAIRNPAPECLSVHLLLPLHK